MTSGAQVFSIHRQGSGLVSLQKPNALISKTVQASNNRTRATKVGKLENCSQPD